jgi:glycosyltransferase involved in cell wall biosynthesis
MYNVTTAIKIGGVETFYWEVSKELKRRGFEIDIVTGEGSYIKYPELNIYQFKFLPRDRVVNFGNRFRKLIERVSFFKNAYPHLKTEKYNFLLIHKPMDFFVAYFMKRINPNIKVIFVSGGEDFYGFDRFFVKYIDYIFSVSRSNKKIIENRYNRSVKVIPNGVDTTLFRRDLKSRELLREKYQLKDKKLLVSAGRVVGWKGYQLVIEALKDKRLKDFNYLLIGDGEYLNELKRLAKDLEVEDRVIFTGAVDNMELYRYLSMGDIFIQPSIGHEAFGITIIEAMACNLPVVASRNGGIVDIVKDGENGYLFDIEDLDGLKEKILLTSSELKKLSKGARESVVKNFTWKKSVDKLLKEIEL